MKISSPTPNLGAPAFQGSPRSRIYGAGEMAEAIRRHPWEGTPLGALDGWPSELVCAVNAMISSRLIACLLWGPERILLYNDRYTPLLDTKHPSLGARFLDVWSKIREQAECMLEEPWLHGSATLVERVPVQIMLGGERVERICSVSNNPIYAETDDGPRVMGIRQTTIDHTEGVLMERKLRKSEARLQQSHAELEAMYESGATAAALIDAKSFRYRRVNAKLAEILNQPMEAIIGTSVFDLASNVHGLRSQLEQVAEGSSFIGVLLEGELANSPGEHRYWQSSYVPVRSGKSEITGIAAVSLEITSQKRAEAALLQSEKLAAVGRLAASIAHEINNPLEAITNLLYLARTTQEPNEVQGYLDTAERELRRASAITTQTLRFYKQSTNPQHVSCTELFSDILSTLAGRLVNSRVQVEQRKRARRPVECFEGEIRQVLSNLVGNAIDALHPTGGRLLVRSREGTSWKSGSKGLVLTVADNGSGMSKQVQQMAFQAFYTTKGVGGTGLGLWISKEIMDRHHGTIRVRSSQMEGASGTVFSLFLPFDAAVR